MPTNDTPTAGGILRQQTLDSAAVGTATTAVTLMASGLDRAEALAIIADKTGATLDELEALLDRARLIFADAR